MKTVKELGNEISQKYSKKGDFYRSKIRELNDELANYRKARKQTPVELIKKVNSLHGDVGACNRMVIEMDKLASGCLEPQDVSILRNYHVRLMNAHFEKTPVQHGVAVVKEDIWIKTSIKACEELLVTIEEGKINRKLNLVKH